MEWNPLDEIVHSLRVPHRQRHNISRELRAHVEDARRELELSGWKPEDATRESLERLGDPAEIADGFTRVYRPSRRTQTGLAVALATGMVLGVWGIGGSLASATTARAHHAPHAHIHVVQR